MRIFISFLILILNFQSWAKADDIRDFEIEGISIGDSALNYFNEETILNEFEIGKDEYSWTDQKFADVYKYDGVELYDKLNIAVKRKDKKYTIYAITGQIDFKDINNCLNKQKEIEKEFSLFLKKTKKKKWVQKHSQDKTGQSKVHYIIFEFKDGAKIDIVCFDLAEHMKMPSGLDVGIVSSEYRNWLNSFDN